MIDIEALKYTVILLKSDGVQIDLSSIVEDLEWEEGENEWSMQTSFFVPNIKYNGVYISSLAKLNCMVFIFSSTGGDDDEHFRGTITDWEVAKSSDEHGFTVYAYDNLYYMQKNEDNRYISEGTGTKSAVTKLFSDWGIPLSYNGPDKKHAKTLFKDETCSKITTALLDDAVSKGADKYCIKSVKGTVYITGRGTNSTIYHLTEDDNAETTSDKLSIRDLVTRVKVVGKEDSEGRQQVEAVVDGDTSFGIHQRIYNRSEDDTISEAKSAAQKILKEYGKPERTTTVEAPDIPVLRRWDKIYIQAGTLDGYYWISAITHKADERRMKIKVVPEGFDETKDDLASVINSAASSSVKSELLIDFGSIQSDMSLRTNTFPEPIPQSDYSVCRQLTLGETNTYLTVTACDGMHMHGPSGPHGHGHYKPSGLHGHGVGEPSPIAVAPPDSKNELPGDAVTKAKETLSEQFAALGMTFTWEDFAATYPDVADPQTIPEDDGADYPSGNGAPEAHSHPADDKGSRHRHPADSREVHTHVKSKESNHVHVVLIPEKMRWLHPGDRVVVVWVQNQAVVVDIILNATAIG